MINRLPESGAWIRPKGSDIAETSVILKPGRRIISEHVQALASEWCCGGRHSCKTAGGSLFNR